MTTKLATPLWLQACSNRCVRTGLIVKLAFYAEAVTPHFIVTTLM
jgi:hypothetical protein